MATGLNIPFQQDQVGAGGTLSKNAQLAKIIGQAFSLGDNNNGFQLGEIGMTSPVFGINDRATAAKIRLHAGKVMKKLKEQERAKLAPNGIRIYTYNENDPDNPPPIPIQPGEILLAIEYLNMETQTPETFYRTFTP